MRARSVRVRLTLWYAGTLAAVLLGFAAASYTYVRHQTYAALDRRLHSEFETIEHNLEGIVIGIVDHEEVPGRWTHVWDLTGKLVHGDPGMAGGVPSPDPSPRTETWPDVGRVRVWAGSYELSVPGGPRPVMLRLALSEEDAREGLALLGWAFALGVPLAVALAAVCGWFLAERALSPIDKMTRRASAITAENLGERLPVGNPDDELGRLARAFNDTFARLQASFDELSRFTADASHELRTPLTALRVVGEVGLKESNQPREVITSMLEEAERMTRLVEDLLELARSPRARLQIEHVDLGALARDVAEQQAGIAEARELSIEVKSNGQATVQADRRTLRRAISNLLDNALRHSPDGATISMRAIKEGDRVSLEVGDAGPGIAPEHREKIFDRFYRIDESRSRAAGGSGLGLAIVRTAVEANGGRVSVESDRGKGSTFRIEFGAD